MVPTQVEVRAQGGDSDTRATGPRGSAIGEARVRPRGEVYYSADHYRNFVQIRGKPHLNDPETAVDRLREEDPKLWNRIEYLLGYFDEWGCTPTRQGGAWGFGVERSNTWPGELLNAPWRVRVPGKYAGGGLPTHTDGYYTEADVWPDHLRSQDH